MVRHLGSLSPETSSSVDTALQVPSPCLAGCEARVTGADSQKEPSCVRRISFWCDERAWRAAL